MIQSDCKWGSNTKYILTKAKERVWFLRRLKILGASRNTLLGAYYLFVRSVLEMAAPLWAGALTKKNNKDIESVQFNCLKLVHGNNFTSYKESLVSSGLETMSARREKICVKFAKKSLKNHRFKNCFPEKISAKTRSGDKFIVPRSNTNRYSTSSIPHLIRLLNKS